MCIERGDTAWTRHASTTRIDSIQHVFIPHHDDARTPSAEWHRRREIARQRQLVQNFLRLLLAYAALPGYYGVDEEESELTFNFWYLFQEALWSAEYEQEFEFGDGDVNAPPGTDKTEQAQWRVAKAVYLELVQVLRRKVVWPEAVTLRTWNRGA